MGLRRGAVAYIHFGARLARPDRFDTCTVYQILFAPVVQRTRIVGLHPTDAGSTPERRTTLNCRISSKVEPAVDNREVLVRFQHPAPFLLNMGDWQRWLMHSPLKRDQAGSIPASPTSICGIGRYGYALAF
jgi:hypothetical protein